MLFNHFFCYVLVSSDGMPRLWNIKSGNIVREYKGHKKAPIYALVFRDAT